MVGPTPTPDPLRMFNAIVDNGKSPLEISGYIVFGTLLLSGMSLGAWKLYDSYIKSDFRDIEDAVSYYFQIVKEAIRPRQ